MTNKKSCDLSAEREGFEPPVPFSTSVFKTGAFDRSATSPIKSTFVIFYF